MKFIVVSGIDGSGKTTVIEMLLERLKDRGSKTHYVWMRYNHILCKPVHGVCRLIGLSKKYDTKTGRVWRHEFYKSPRFFSFYVVLTYIDTWIGKLRLIYQLKRMKPEVVVCDRWIVDIIIDLAVKSRDISFFDSRMCRFFFRLQPDNLKQYVIVRNEAEILSCRPENQEDPDFVFRIQCYEKILSHTNVARIDNSGSVADSVEQILTDEFCSRE